MAELRSGRVSAWKALSPILATFCLEPEEGHPFPAYQPGQYMALRREDALVTRRVVSQDGRPHYVAEVDDGGHERHGPVTHSYSIASAPFETAQNGHLEFYVVLETDEEGHPGRLTESLFRIHDNDRLTYVDRIVGDFTLAKRGRGFRNVLFVGTGTGLAPFISMLKQLDYEARNGRGGDIRYTLVHTNRTFGELAYHDQLLEMAARRTFDFVYVPSVSRPTQRDREDPNLGIGRANNLLRHLFNLPSPETGDYATRAVEPLLPSAFSRETLLARLAPSETVVLTCGNPNLMDDIKKVADSQGFRFEKEDW